MSKKNKKTYAAAASFNENAVVPNTEPRQQYLNRQHFKRPARR